jgi:hypothetical protein
MVDTRILSKYWLSWNSRAVIRCAGRLVISRGRTWVARSLGKERFDKKSFAGEGTVDEEANVRL